MARRNQDDQPPRDNVIPFPTSQSRGSHEGDEHPSLDELETAIGAQFRRLNDSAEADFLGLSPAQMTRILYSKLSDNGDMLTVAPQSAQCGPSSVPMVRHAVLFLSKAREQQPLKATQQGNLPQRFVQEIFPALLDGKEPEIREMLLRYPPRREGDSGDVELLRHVLVMGGLFRKQRGTFAVTRAAERILDSQDWAALYVRLFTTMAEEMNWAWIDYRSAFPLLQAATIFDLYILKRKAAEFVSADRLAGCFLQAFPTAVDDFEEAGQKARDEVADCYVGRFLDEFCVPLALVAVRGTKSRTSRTFRQYRQSALFRHALKWGL